MPEEAFGVWPVIAGCLATAFIGGALLRIQGLAAMRGAERDLREGRMPVEAAVDGLFLAVAAPLLMTPGFLTDALGFALLAPPVRHFIARRVAEQTRNRPGGQRGERSHTKLVEAGRQLGLSEL